MMYFPHLSSSDAFSLILALGIVWSLYRAHRDKNGLRDFNLFDLIMENGRVSKLAAVFMGGTLLISWIMVQLTIAGKMTEGYLGLYFAGVIAPVISKLFSPLPPSTTTITETSKETKVVAGTPGQAGGTMNADTVNIQADTANLNTKKS